MTYFVLQRENTMQTSTDTTPAKNLMSSLSEIDDIDLKNSCVAIGFAHLSKIECTNDHGTDITHIGVISDRTRSVDFSARKSNNVFASDAVIDKPQMFVGWTVVNAGAIASLFAAPLYS